MSVPQKQRLLAGQQRARMPVEENQWIEIAAVPDYRSTSEQPLNLFLDHGICQTV
jgi:hypothetical protein